MSFRTSLNAIVNANRLRATSKTVIKGGESGKQLAKEAKLSQDITEGRVEVDGVEKDVFILGLHPMTDDYIVL